MSFLQPWLLAGLPLVALPIIIHLLNRRRHKTVAWGAMMFLLQATRRSKKKQRLRYLLIMLARMLAIAGLIFAISRPLSSGWLGMFGATPDTVIVVLDRSASMSQQDMQTGQSKRSVAIQQVTDALAITGQPPNLVLIGSGMSGPQPIASPRSLIETPDAGATDASADIPALLQSALDYVVANNTGRTDIWICSDLQQEDWNSDSGQWPTLRDGFLRLKQSVRFHLLTYQREAPDNVAVRLESVRRVTSEDEHQLRLDILLRRTSAVAAVDVPVAVVVDGARSVVDVRMDSDTLVLSDHPVPIDAARLSGFGKVEIPNDSNQRDNAFYFAYGEDVIRQTVIVTDRAELARPLSLAVAPPSQPGASVSVVDPGQIDTIDWAHTALVIWQAPLPAEMSARQLELFVQSGGCLMFIPPEVDTDGNIFGFSWGAVEQAPADIPYAVANWQDDSGLLQRSQSGRALPVGRLRIHQHRRIHGKGRNLATLSNGLPLLVQFPTDSEAGAVFACGTLPGQPYSNMSREGVVMFVMLQRALELGTGRLSSSLMTTVGQPIPGTANSDWRQLDGWPEGALSTQHRLVAGIYQSGDKTVARNRPFAEDLGKPLASEQLEQLMGDLDYHIVQDQVRDASPLVNEIWRMFIVGMVVALLAEAWLCLPDEQTARAQATFGFAESIKSESRAA